MLRKPFHLLLRRQMLMVGGLLLALLMSNPVDVAASPVYQGTLPTLITLVLSPSPSYIEQPVTLTATVTDFFGGNGTPTGTVEFIVQGSAVGTVVLVDGSASIATTFTAQGVSFPYVIYSGDTVFSGNTGGTNHEVVTLPTMTTVVSDVNPSVNGQSVTFTATVTSISGSGIPTGGVFFSTTRGLFLAPLDSNGVAVYTNTGYTSVFTDFVTATYEGDATFASSTSAPLTQVINPASTAVTLISSVNPSSAGEAVTFTAQVTSISPGSGIPWGAVTFSLDGAFLGEGFLAFGTASIGPLPLSPGQHIIEAAFRENSDFHSSSASLTQVVSAPPSVQDDIQRIIDTANGMNIHQGTKNSLIAKLNAALSAVNSQNGGDGSNQLSAFIREVEAQRGKKITTGDATTLVALANAVLARLSN